MDESCEIVKQEIKEEIIEDDEICYESPFEEISLKCEVENEIREPEADPLEEPSVPFLNLFALCRVCGGPSPDTTSIPLAEIAGIIANCLSIQVNEDVNMPRQVCHSCFNQLQQWSCFKRKVNQAQHFFKIQVALRSLPPRVGPAPLPSAPPVLVQPLSWKCEERELFECYDCNFMTYNESRLVNHQSSHIQNQHNGRETLRAIRKLAKRPISPTNPYKCGICTYKCKLVGSFRRHLLLHIKANAGLTSYPCAHCNIYFRNVVILTNHQTDHILNPEKKVCHECQECGRAFLEARKLKDHELIHKGERNFVCLYCGADFLTINSIKLYHTPKCHPDKAFKYRLKSKTEIEAEKLSQTESKTSEEQKKDKLSKKKRSKKPKVSPKSKIKFVKKSSILRTIAPKEVMSVMVSEPISVLSTEVAPNLAPNILPNLTIPPPKLPKSVPNILRKSDHILSPNVAKFAPIQPKPNLDIIAPSSSSDIIPQPIPYIFIPQNALQNTKQIIWNIPPLNSSLWKFEFPCGICGQEFTTENDFLNHVKNEFDNSSLYQYIPCGICNNLFTKVDELLDHLISHRNQQLEYQCEFCLSIFDHIIKLKEHKAITHSPCYRCKYCLVTFSHKTKFDEHTHNGHCNDKFETIHQSIICKPRTYYKCKFCTEITYSRAWDDHFNSSHKSISLCENERGYRYVLHQPTVIRNDLQELESLGLLYVCKTCDVSCINVDDMKSHLIMYHTGNEEFSCEFCSKGCKNLDSLKNHVSNHILSNFLCSICNHYFTTKKEILNHIDRDHGEGKECALLTCLFCCKGFTDKWVLEKHMYKHVDRNSKNESSDYRHNCQLCDEVFLKKSIYLKHLEEHTKKPFQCINCFTLFTSQSRLKLHLKIVKCHLPFC